MSLADDQGGEALTVILKPTSSQHSSRSLTLTFNGGPILIGRASKSECRSNLAKEDNALFECPVVSREHAQLRFDHNAPKKEQVLIFDLGSMHGTFVNDINIGRFIPFTLRNGDRVRLGNNVSRGNGDSYQGLTFTFERIDITSPRSECMSSGSTFSVPAGTDEEIESDYGSDTDSVLKPELVSSAHTTPESKKQNLGSHCDPIEVEDCPAGSLRRIIDIVEDVTAASASKPGLALDSFVMSEQFRNAKSCFEYEEDEEEDGEEEEGDVEEDHSEADLYDEDDDEFYKQQEQDLTETHHSRILSPELGEILEPEVDFEKPVPASIQQYKPAYDPVRDGPKPQSPALNMTGKSMCMAHIFPPITECSAYPTYFETLHRPAYVGASKATEYPVIDAYEMPAFKTVHHEKQAANKMSIPHITMAQAGWNNEESKKRKIDNLEDVMMNAEEDHLEAVATTAKEDHTIGSKDVQQDGHAAVVEDMPARKKLKKSRTTSSTATLLKDIGKYSVGAALGATGTFTFLISPLGGMLVDWASKL